jgi:hypothetical protein
LNNKLKSVNYSSSPLLSSLLLVELEPNILSFQRRDSKANFLNKASNGKIGWIRYAETHSHITGLPFAG